MTAQRTISWYTTFSLSMVLIVSVAHAVEPVARGDLFDTTAGATVTDASPNTITPATNMLGTGGGVESASLLFGDGAPAGTVLFVEWELPTTISLAGFNLRAQDDGVQGAFPFERSFDHVRLLADSGSGFVPFYDADVAVPYNGTDEQDMLLISAAIAPVAARRFRAEFTQALTCTFCGPRVVELDGYPAAVCADGNYSGTTTSNDAFLALLTSIGLASCPLCACDVDDGGTITSTDALGILTASVGLPHPLTCPNCFAPTP